MADGWLWLSMRMATAIPSPASITPAFSPGPTSTSGPSVGQAAEVAAGRLVGAVLAPHDGVHGQFQVVGRAAQEPLEEASSSLRPSWRCNMASMGSTVVSDRQRPPQGRARSLSVQKPTSGRVW